VFTAGGVVAKPDELDVDGKQLVGDGAIRYRSIFEAAGAEIPPDNDPRHAPHAQLLVPHMQALVPLDTIEPMYVREPDAKPSAA